MSTTGADDGAQYSFDFFVLLPKGFIEGVAFVSAANFQPVACLLAFLSGNFEFVDEVEPRLSTLCFFDICTDTFL